MRVELEPAYILHSQAFSNTSLLLDVFTQNHGRFRMVAKGVRSAKSPRRAFLQLFTPIKVSWSGRSDLKTLTDVELNIDTPPTKLQGNALFNGLYANELLIKLTFAFDPHEEIFFYYRELLISLASTQSDLQALRLFEMQLLESLGYSLGIEALDDLEASELWYQYQPEMGLQLHSGQQSALPLVQGKYLFDLLSRQAIADEGMQQLKQLMRFAIHQHLDGKSIETRALYQ